MLGHMSLTRISMSSRATTISRKLSSRFIPRLLIRSIVTGWRFPGLFGRVEVYPSGGSSCLPGNRRMSRLHHAGLSHAVERAKHDWQTDMSFSDKTESYKQTITGSLSFLWLHQWNTGVDHLTELVQWDISQKQKRHTFYCTQVIIQCFYWASVFQFGTVCNRRRGSQVTCSDRILGRVTDTWRDTCMQHKFIQFFKSPQKMERQSYFSWFNSFLISWLYSTEQKSGVSKI